MGDFRHYINLGTNYTIALRGSGAYSLGPESQTYFLGGMMGWINYRWSEYAISLERFTDTFFTLPAMPLRGYAYSDLFGNKYSLINTEFRFPLFAAILPGALPVLPFYNITGAFFLDVGTAWGIDNVQTFRNPLTNGPTIPIPINGKELDFRIGEESELYYDFAIDQIVTDPSGPNTGALPYIDGDILIGAGFGLRSIIFGLPLRWDMGWPYTRSGFGRKPIHYISIGIDF